jgi:16S rRNA (cytidine1402-2'-O)-methyltransferase
VVVDLPPDFPPRQPPIARGCLYLVATPIGNLEDITLRAVRVLGEVDAIAAEDTRTARKLLRLLGIDKPLISLFEGNEAQRVPGLLARLQAGEALAVISEAGTPAISDPGHQLSRACREAGIPVDAIPGPAAVINALLLSTLSPARFRFLGFLPRKGAARREALELIAAEPDTSVLYESPQRLARTLADLAPLLGDRALAVAREMTKLHQEVLHGRAAELAERFADQAPRGEICLVIAGRPEAPPPSEESLELAVRERLKLGETPRAIADALDSPQVKRRQIYQLAIRLARDLL